MGVQDGFPVNAAYTNPRFINKNVNDVMPFELGFTYAPAGSNIASIQAAVNKLYAASGASESTTGTVYNATPSTITNGQNYQTALTVLAGKFDPATGHRHTGAPGDGPLIAAGVESIAVNGNPPATGAITLFNGQNISMTQMGANITVGTTNTPIFGTSGAIAGSMGLAAASGGIFTQNPSPTTATYGVTWPSAQAASAGYALINDGVGNLTWGQAGTASPLTTKGDIYGYDTGNARLPVGTDGQDLIPDSNQTLGVRYADSVVKNYVRINSDADVSIGNWATFADAAANIPVDGTGGSPSITWTRTTSVPLAGPGAFLFTKSGSANRQGQGASISFSMDAACQGQVIAVTFDYKIVSGTFTASNGITPPLNDGTTTTNAGNSDLEAFMYDVTNSVLIPITPQVLTSSSSVSGQFKGLFQASINSTSYRLIIFQATNTTNNYTAQFDNFFVGRQAVSYGYAGSDWSNSLTFLPSAGYGTVSLTNYGWRRVGDTMQVYGTFKSGTVAASTAYIQLPAGYVIDTTKFTTQSQLQSVGVNWVVPTGAGGAVGSSGMLNTMFYDGSTNNQIFVAQTAGSNTFIKRNCSSFMANNDSVSFEFSVPIAGWSSNVLMSTDTASRIVDMNASPSGATSASDSTFTRVTGWTTIKDSAGSFNGTTYTVPVAGDYDIEAAVYWSGNSTNRRELYVYRNGTAYRLLGKTINLSSSGAFQQGGSTLITGCVPGDTIEIYIWQNSGGSLALDNTSAFSFFNVTRISGPATIAAAEQVFLQYTGNAGTSLTANVTNIDFTTKVVDSHNAWSGTIFTAPRASLYYVQCMTVITVAGQVFISIYVNTVQKLTLNQAAASGQVTGGSTAQYLNAGDTVSIRMDTNKVLSNSAQSHWITISSQ